MNCENYGPPFKVFLNKKSIYRKYNTLLGNHIYKKLNQKNIVLNYFDCLELVTLTVAFFWS